METCFSFEHYSDRQVTRWVCPNDLRSKMQPGWLNTMLQWWIWSTNQLLYDLKNSTLEWRMDIYPNNHQVATTSFAEKAISISLKWNATKEKWKRSYLLAFCIRLLVDTTWKQRKPKTVRYSHWTFEYPVLVRISIPICCLAIRTPAINNPNECAAIN